MFSLKKTINGQESMTFEEKCVRVWRAWRAPFLRWERSAALEMFRWHRNQRYRRQWICPLASRKGFAVNHKG